MMTNSSELRDAIVYAKGLPIVESDHTNCQDANFGLDEAELDSF